ncbi:MAG: hypothetical protein KTR28_08675 [Micavibrio sp.]|nr:hypothetical protein [Micavibrio sp.]
MTILKYLILAVIALPLPAIAQDGSQTCSIKRDSACAFTLLENEANRIENVTWRDQTYREIAKLMAAEGMTERAVSYIAKIQTPDTKAMTIRGIGMAAAELAWDKARYDTLFTALRAEAERITAPQSYAIALTYIAMGQAFAGDDVGAWATAASMESDSLRFKAYGETAEIQAEQGKPDAALKSIGMIDSAAYRNKAYTTVSKIFAERGKYDEALQTAMPINNAYKKAEAITYLLDKKRHEDLTKRLKKVE